MLWPRRPVTNRHMRAALCRPLWRVALRSLAQGQRSAILTFSSARSWGPSPDGPSCAAAPGPCGCRTARTRRLAGADETVRRKPLLIHISDRHDIDERARDNPLNPKIIPELSVAVAIPAFTMDRWELLVRAVESIRDQTVHVEEVVLCIDNNLELLERAQDKWRETSDPVVTVIPNRHGVDHQRVSLHETAHGSRRRFGAGSARNTAADRVRADVMAFMDDDARAEPDWIERLLEVFASPSVVAVGGPPIPDYETSRPDWYPGNFDWVFGCAYDGLPISVQPLRHLIGANMAVRQTAFDAVGGFVGSDFDDLNLCMRLIERFGVENVIYTPFARVRHYVTAERVTWRYFWRRCYFVNREKVRVFRHIGTAANLVAERQFVIHALTKQSRATLRSLRHGDTRALRVLGAMIAGIGLAGLGHVCGQIDRLHSARLSSQAVATARVAIGRLSLAWPLSDPRPNWRIRTRPALAGASTLCVARATRRASRLRSRVRRGYSRG